MCDGVLEQASLRQKVNDISRTLKQYLGVEASAVSKFSSMLGAKRAGTPSRPATQEGSRPGTSDSMGGGRVDVGGFGGFGGGADSSRPSTRGSATGGGGGGGGGPRPTGMVTSQISEMWSTLEAMRAEHAQLMQDCRDIKEWNELERLAAEARLKSALWDEQGQSTRLTSIEAQLSMFAPLEAVGKIDALTVRNTCVTYV